MASAAPRVGDDRRKGCLRPPPPPPPPSTLPYRTWPSSPLPWTAVAGGGAGIPLHERQWSRATIGLLGRFENTSSRIRGEGRGQWLIGSFLYGPNEGQVVMHGMTMPPAAARVIFLLAKDARVARNGRKSSAISADVTTPYDSQAHCSQPTPRAAAVRRRQRFITRPQGSTARSKCRSPTGHPFDGEHSIGATPTSPEEVSHAAPWPVPGPAKASVAIVGGRGVCGARDEMLRCPTGPRRPSCRRRRRRHPRLRRLRHRRRCAHNARGLPC